MGFEFLRANDRDRLVAARLPARLRPASVAVLLCNPFGEEAVRAHRAYRVLAQRLEAAGYATLRFDYAGTGDSGGDSDAFTPDDWIDDIAAAADELRRLAGVSRIVLAGLRLGATLAAHAAQRSDVRAAHVVLWDPVVDGRGYLAELAQSHRAYLEEETGQRQPDASDTPGEAMGMPLSPALREGLAALDLTASPPAAPMTTVICSRRSAEMARLHAAWTAAHPAVHWIDVDASQAWNSDAALNAAVVPINEVLALVDRIKTCHP